jgi:hypothetical protein
MIVFREPVRIGFVWEVCNGWAEVSFGPSELTFMLQRVLVLDLALFNHNIVLCLISRPGGQCLSPNVNLVVVVTFCTAHRPETAA